MKALIERLISLGRGIAALTSFIVIVTLARLIFGGGGLLGLGIILATIVLAGKLSFFILDPTLTSDEES